MANDLVFHSITTYLDLTQTWLYASIKNQQRYCPVIICEKTDNRDMFPFARVLCPKSAAWGFADVFNKSLIRSLKLEYSPYAYLSARRYRPVLWHSHFGNRGFFDMGITKKLNIPHVVTFYGYDAGLLPTQHKEWGEMYLRLFESCSKILVEGTHFKDVLLNIGCSIEKIAIQRIGVDTERIPFVPRQLETGETLKIMIVGNFREKKGIPYALEGVAIAHKECKNIKISVYGDAGSHPRERTEKDKILKSIQRHHLEDVVELKGYVDFNTLYKDSYSHHILMQPSITSSDGDIEGGSPVIITEMLAAGMPVIATYHCDIPEVVINKKCGLLSPERDSQHLAENILFFYQNPDCLYSYGMNGRAHVEKNYNLTKQLMRLEKIYDQIVSLR